MLTILTNVNSVCHNSARRLFLFIYSISVTCACSYHHLLQHFAPAEMFECSSSKTPCIAFAVIQVRGYKGRSDGEQTPPIQE